MIICSLIKKTGFLYLIRTCWLMLGYWFWRAAYFFLQQLEYHKQYRNYKYAQHGTYEHTSHRARAYGTVAGCACACCQH